MSKLTKQELFVDYFARVVHEAVKALGAGNTMLVKRFFHRLTEFKYDEAAETIYINNYALAWRDFPNHTTGEDWFDYFLAMPDAKFAQLLPREDGEELVTALTCRHELLKTVAAVYLAEGDTELGLLLTDISEYLDPAYLEAEPKPGMCEGCLLSNFCQSIK